MLLHEGVAWDGVVISGAGTCFGEQRTREKEL